MQLPLHIAEKLRLMLSGEKIPSSQLRHPVIKELIAEGILHRQGKVKSTLQLIDPRQLNYYLDNYFAINDLDIYIETLKKAELLRQELILATTDSKLKPVRTFKGFLVNCYTPIKAMLKDQRVILSPLPGTFTFIYDYDHFIPDPEVTIVGIENPENFRHIDKQQELFEGIKPLFISRYPQQQSKDLLKWLKKIPNRYLHFGDFDLAGIGIYLNEYQKHLGSRAAFFVPENIDQLISRYGNKKRYDLQKINFNPENIVEEELSRLIQIIHTHHKGLDQEILIREDE